MKKLPSARLLRRLIDYDPATGEMRWKERPVWMFSGGQGGSGARAAAWNTRYAGALAFTADNGKGYRCGGVFGRRFFAHRVAFAHYYGRWPEDQIDHINGRRDDNRITNLRDATPIENARNTKLYKRNTSGAHGVWWSKQYLKWVAQIRLEGRGIHLGHFDTKDAAVAARKVAESALKFSENHGRAA